MTHIGTDICFPLLVFVTTKIHSNEPNLNVFVSSYLVYMYLSYQEVIPYQQDT